MTLVRESSLRGMTAISLILLAGVLTYNNSLDGEFVFDDLDSIPENPTLRSLAPSVSFFPPRNRTVSGRPLLNFTLAVNYAVGRYDVTGYHLVNVLVHMTAAVMLFLVVRGVLRLSKLPDDLRQSATGIGLAVALVWVVHPLQTEVVSYVVQRGESLVALFLFLSLYCLLRGASSAGNGTWWYAGAVASCALGMLSKEVMAAAPVIALLFDRAFLAGSFREVLRRRGLVHAGLVSAWGILAPLVLGTEGRGGTAGFATTVSPFQYAAAQPVWILHYLRLSVWPNPLVFDYGPAAALGRRTLLASTATLSLLALAVATYKYHPAWGFLPLAFFTALAPSSSFVPIATQVAAERRMYLPLAALVTLAVIGAVRLGGVLPVSTVIRRWTLAGFLVAWVLLLAVQTHLRNRDYKTALALWTDTATKVPDNPRAHVNLGRALLAKGRTTEAVRSLRKGVALAPDEPQAHSLLGFALAEQGHLTEAAACFREVVRLDPDNASAQENLAVALHADRQLDEAIQWYQKALQSQPDNAELHFSLGNALGAVGRKREARESFQNAARLDPKYAQLLKVPPDP